MRMIALLPEHRRRLRRSVTMHYITDAEQEELYRLVMWFDMDTDEPTPELKAALKKLEDRGAIYVYQGWQIHDNSYHRERIVRQEP